MAALQSEATCRLGKKAATYRRTPNLLSGLGRFLQPQGQALSRSPFSAVWKLRRFLQAGGRSLLMSIRAPLGRWIDRSVGRCQTSLGLADIILASSPERFLGSIHLRARRESGAAFFGAKKVKKTVLHLFSGLDTSAQT
jgi:hypothetical protein